MVYLLNQEFRVRLCIGRLLLPQKAPPYVFFRSTQPQSMSENQCGDAHDTWQRRTRMSQRNPNNTWSDVPTTWLAMRKIPALIDLVSFCRLKGVQVAWQICNWISVELKYSSGPVSYFGYSSCPMHLSLCMQFSVHLQMVTYSRDLHLGLIWSMHATQGP